MNDYLGTSIQFSEQQLLRLEKEHDIQMEQTAQRLIDSGFLESDYDGSSGEFTDFEDSEVDLSDSHDITSDHDMVDNIETNYILNKNFDHKSTSKDNVHQNQNEKNLSLTQIISDIAVGSTDYVMESINDKENEPPKANKIQKLQKLQEEETEDEMDEMKSYSSSDYDEFVENDGNGMNEQILYAIISAYDEDQDEDEDEDNKETEKEEIKFNDDIDDDNHTKIHLFNGYIAINDEFEMFAEQMFHFLNNQCSQMIIIDIDDTIYEFINQYSCAISIM